MIKLKPMIDSAYESQKYVIATDRLRKNLAELTESSEYKKLPLSKSVLSENYLMIAEWVSLAKDDLYHYSKTGNCWYSFIDRNNVKHEIRVSKGAGGIYEAKMWFIDKNNKPNYSPPNVYGNLKYDTAIFNTYIYILLNEILPYFFKELPKEKLYLPATDKIRYRLYKITLGNHLDKTKYSLEDLGSNTLSVSIKN